MRLAGGPTQDEVMAISLQKLNADVGDVFAEIGCGTGKISVAISKQVKRAYAVDRRKVAIDAARSSIKDAKADNVTLLHQEGLQFLKECEELDCAFVGGTKQLDSMLELLSQKVKGKIVVNVVLVSSLDRCIKKMKVPTYSKRSSLFRYQGHIR